MKKTSKKMLSLMCLAMLASSAASSLVSAEVIQNPDGTVTIDNGNGKTPDTTSSIKVAGEVGFDNKNPNKPDPQNPKEWLNLTVPTEMVFASTEKSKHQDIEGNAGEIKNHSGRPVEVRVKSFTDGAGAAADMTGIASLDLIGGITNAKFDLMNFKEGILTILDSPQATGQNGPITGKSQVALKLSGKVDTGLKKAHKSDNKLELEFQPLDKNGQPFSATPTPNP